MPVSSPTLRLNPLLLDHVNRHGGGLRLAITVGVSEYLTFYALLHADQIHLTPLLLDRLERVADAVGFPKDQLFLDET